MPHPPAAPPFDVFISYHSGDAEWVAKLKTALEQSGLRVWVDSAQIRPGDLFPRALASAIGSVRCVVLVLSPGSVASAWVQEEYSLALAQRCHVVPVLLEQVEPPGFLAGRTWVDFRDPARFDDSLDQLVFGITGQAPAGAAMPAAPVFRDDPAPPDTTDEAVVLQRLIARRRQDTRRLWLARALSPVAGFPIGGAFFAIGSGSAVEMRLAVGAIPVAIVMLAGWGATAISLARLKRKMEQFELLKDGLEACRARSHPGCSKLRQHFWDMMVRTAADAGFDVSRARP